MAKLSCPLKCDCGYTHSSGDGWDEWDECRCCNPDGDNDSGMVTERQLSAFEKREAAEKAHVDAQIRAWEVAMAQPCPKCGVALIDHANRDGEPCKSIEKYNEEWRAAVAAKAV